MKNQMQKIKKWWLVFAFLLLTTLYLLPTSAHAATFSLSSASQTFEVGETFDVSILLDTQGQEINAVELGLEFPADKLQVVSPNTGKSIIEIWAGQPKFNNKDGLVEMRGGFPGGITITNGLITTIRFRVKASGSSFLQFTPDTKVLANDGQGTNVLVRTPGAIYAATLPRAAGPAVSSPTHPDQSRWFSNTDAVIEWVGEPGAEGYSFILNNDALFKPDTISEGSQTTISYTQLESGTYFFHVRSLQDGVWGGVTHFQINIDKTPPAEFEIEVLPSARTSVDQPVLKFFTTDAQSGIDHYEMKVISLAQRTTEAEADLELFSDVQSPHILFPLEPGSYDVLLRAYDKAYNYREVTRRLAIVSPLLGIVQNEGLRITSAFTISWMWFWLVALLVLLFFGFAGWRLKHWPKRLGLHERKNNVPETVRKQLEELKVYRKKYGKIAVIVLFVLSLGIGGSVTVAQTAHESNTTTSVLTPPHVTTISRDLTTEETFYVGGETVTPQTDVVVYWSNLTTGETLSAATVSNESGEWFYHHPAALTKGNYVLWSQSRIGETMSPPSSQLTMVVRTGALKLGPARVSYELAYLLIIGVLVAIVFTLGFLVIRHWSVIKREHRKFLEEVRKGEESIRRGFALLRHDMEMEFALIKKIKMERKLSTEEQRREQQIMQDLEVIEGKVGQEIWELEKLEGER